jgi:two-component system, NarL family, sensor kinase
VTAKRGRSRGGPRALARLRARLADAEETLRAIRAGEVDAVVVAGEGGPRVFTLEGAEHGYRVLIESMNEGALTLTADKVILYANRCFAAMVKRPLEQVIGSSFREYISEEERAELRPLVRRAAEDGSKILLHLKAPDGSRLPAQVSIRPLPTHGDERAAVALVVTDMTEALRNEAELRALYQRLTNAQETERGRVALELHDHITQLLCAVLLRSQALADGLSEQGGPAKAEAVRLREMLGRTAEEVERISRGLRPSVLDQLGLVPVLRSTAAEFSERTGVAVDLACGKLRERLPAGTELSLYRILQEALKNVERHAGARRVNVAVTQRADSVELSVADDGIGFDTGLVSARRRTEGRGLGLLGMGERAAQVDGTLTVESSPGEGTTVAVRVPCRVVVVATATPGRPRSRRRRPA